MQKPTRIIGIDPGLRKTGWGVLDTTNASLQFVSSGTICSNSKRDLSFRLRQLYDDLRNVFSMYHPDEAAVEATFVNRDPVSALKLGQARGVAMLVPALCDVSVSEYAPNKVKKTILGVGHGEKQQIAMMVKRLLPTASFDGADSADALAIAICHAHYRQSIEFSYV